MNIINEALKNKFVTFLEEEKKKIFERQSYLKAMIRNHEVDIERNINQNEKYEKEIIDFRNRLNTAIAEDLMICQELTALKEVKE